MGIDVYVLMLQEGKGEKKEWRPVAVVTNPDIAAQWIAMGGRDPESVDWVPFGLDEYQHIGPENMPEFKPKKLPPIAQRAIDTAKRLEETVTKLQGIIEQYQTQCGPLKAKGQVKQRTTPATAPPVKASLLKPASKAKRKSSK